MQKCDFFDVKWLAIRRILSIWAQNSHCTLEPIKIRVCKYHRDLCKIDGARCGTNISVHIVDPNVAAEASNQSKTYRSHTIHVGHNYKALCVCLFVCICGCACACVCVDRLVYCHTTFSLVYTYKFCLPLNFKFIFTSKEKLSKHAKTCNCQGGMCVCVCKRTTDTDIQTGGREG